LKFAKPIPDIFKYTHIIIYADKSSVQKKPINIFMGSLTDLIANFGDIIELSLPSWNIDNAIRVLTKHPGWTQYNPRKPTIKRYGLSVTSLDGGFSGIPDLDSLKEYNKENNSKYTEAHFRSRTNIVNYIPELNILLDLFPDHGRCHFLRLDAGGFFPPHRDNGTAYPLPHSFRIIVPICNFGKYQTIWLQEGNPIIFEHGRTYFVNTTKVHSLFSFVDMSCCFVMNIEVTDNSINNILKNILIS